MARNTKHWGYRHINGAITGETIAIHTTPKATCESILKHSVELLELGHPLPIIYEIHDDCGRRVVDVHVWGIDNADILCPLRDAAQCDAARDHERTRTHLPDGALDNMLGVQPAA